MLLIVPITASVAADADISLPAGAKLDEIGAAWKFVGSDGTAAAAFSALTVDAKGDGNTEGAGHIKLQADGTKVRVGDALDSKSMIIIFGIAPGEVQGFGEV